MSWFDRHEEQIQDWLAVLLCMALFAAVRLVYSYLGFGR